jgi:hypothetical protein
MTSTSAEHAFVSATIIIVKTTHLTPTIERLDLATFGLALLRTSVASASLATQFYYYAIND